MTSSANSLIHLQKTGGIAGILSVVFYFSVAVLSFLPDPIALGLAFSFPLLWIIAFMGLYQFLKAEKQSASLEIAYLFGIIGAAIACVLLVVQQANFIWHAQAMEQVATEEAQALLKATFRGANRVQAGMDVAFDILIAAGLLTLNMITFPTAPAEAGLFDLGPFLGIWALVVYIWFTVVLFKRKDAIAN